MKNRKKIIFVSIIVIIIIGFGLFFATSQEKTDVYFKDVEVSADGKTMTLKIGASNNTGYVSRSSLTTFTFSSVVNSSLLEQRLSIFLSILIPLLSICFLFSIFHFLLL